MNIISTKVLVAVLFGFIRFISGIFPIYLCSWLKIRGDIRHATRTVSETKRKKLECLVTLMQAFGSGVLFATCFLHMIPEVHRSVQKLRRYGTLQTDYPYSQLLVCFGFFVIYTVEEISQWILLQIPLFSCGETTKTDSTTTVVPKENKIVPEFISTDGCSNKATQTIFSQTKTEFKFEINAEVEELVDENLMNQQQILRCVVILLALSFQSVFEGFAIGLQDSIANIWYLFTAISIHSATILFSFGLEIFLAGNKTKTILVHVFVLAITSPLAVIAGLTIILSTKYETNTKSFAVALIEGLSAGAILYITFFEVLSREKGRRICVLKRYVCLSFGFLLMAGLEYINVE